MEDVYGDAYMQVFGAALSAAVAAAHQLSSEQIDRLVRYRGIVGLAAEHVQATRSHIRRGTPPPDLRPPS